MSTTKGQKGQSAKAEAKRFNPEIFEKLWANHKIPTQRIADAMGISRQGAGWHAKRMGLPSREKVRRIKHDPALLAEMWIAKVSSADIAAHFGMAHHACVTTAARVAGLPPRKRGSSGRMNGGWEATISAAEFFEGKRLAALNRALIEDAKSVAAQFRLAEMVDGKRKAA